MNDLVMYGFIAAATLACARVIKNLMPPEPPKTKDTPRGYFTPDWPTTKSDPSISSAERRRAEQWWREQ